MGRVHTNRIMWEAPLHAFLDEQEGRTVRWEDTEDRRVQRAKDTAFRHGRGDLEAAVRSARAVGYAQGVQDTVDSFKRAAFRAQAYDLDLWVVLGL